MFNSNINNNNQAAVPLMQRRFGGGQISNLIAQIKARLDALEGGNWRTGGGNRWGSNPPSTQPVPIYGLPIPPENGGNPPTVQPIYGLPVPPENGGKPPVVQPIYGLPVPPENDGNPPIAQPVYGLPIPPEVDGKPPTVQPVYGLPLPPEPECPGTAVPLTRNT